MSNLFDMVLQQSGLRFSEMLDDEGKDEIRAFWDDIVNDRGHITDAEIESVLSTYKGLGVIVPADIITNAQEKELKLLDRTWNAGSRGHIPTKEALASWLNSGYDRPTLADAKDPEQAVEDFREGLKDKRSDIVGAGKEAIIHAADKIDHVTREMAGTAVTIPSAKAKKDHCTYTLLYQKNNQASSKYPLMILSDPMHRLPHHQVGAFTDPARRTAFEYVMDGEPRSADILQIDRRFAKLLDWLGQGHIAVKLSGRPWNEGSVAEQVSDMRGTVHTTGYAVYKIRAVDVNSNEILQTANNDFLQLVIRRMLASEPKEDLPEEQQEHQDTSDPSMILTDMPAMTDFVNCAEDSLPDNIRNWAHRQIAMVNSNSVSKDEQKHAQRALSIMLNIQWQDNWFPAIDPREARRILDEELYGMEEVKQRIIETVIQINRTHTLPAYGLLLVGPAGTGKSQVAYAVAKILRLPWCSLDMSAIRDTEALTGSPRVYTNAKPGKIMEAFSQAGTSNLVIIINELDKAGVGASNGNPADALLTLLDNLGFTDNYIECQIPTGGVYPIATANDRRMISNPLLTRFAEIDLPDYTPEEKKIIFRDYSLPKILRRMGMNSAEVRFTDDAIEAIVGRYQAFTGVRDLEQAAEHLVAHALYEIEVSGDEGRQILYTAEAVAKILR